MTFSVGSEAFLWGIASAISLPVGAVLGLWLRPRQKINSAFMAFGAGALLFALTIELFGHVPHHVEGHGMGAMLAAGLGAIGGGLLFDFLNQMLNNRGAFLRSLSNAKRFVACLKIQRANDMVAELSRVKVLTTLSPKDMARLIERVQRQSFSAGEVIFNQGDAPSGMYFIISGQVDVVLHDGGSGDKKIAQLDAKDTFGEIGVLTGASRTADVKAVTDVVVYTLMKADFDEIFKESAELQKTLKDLAEERVHDLSAKSENVVNAEWKAQILAHLEEGSVAVTADDIAHAGAEKAAGGAAFAIWLGIMIDGVPESLVIGMLAMSAAGMSYAFVAGVFLANLPEAMSSAVTMRKGGMGIKRIMLMWGSITLITGIGAYLGTVIFPAEPTGAMFYAVLGIEGLAAGAMLTMIAETMLPEAFEQGGSIVGFSTLCGFLAALVVKVL